MTPPCLSLGHLRPNDPNKDDPNNAGERPSHNTDLLSCSSSMFVIPPAHRTICTLSISWFQTLALNSFAILRLLFSQIFSLIYPQLCGKKESRDKEKNQTVTGGVMWWKPGSRTGKSIFFFDTLLFLTARRTEYKLMHLSSYTCCNTQGKSGVQIWLPCMDTAQTSRHHSSERWAASGITGRHESCTWCNLIQPLRHHSTVTGLCLQLGSFLNFKEEWSVHD